MGFMTVKEKFNFSREQAKKQAGVNKQMYKPFLMKKITISKITKALSNSTSCITKSNLAVKYAKLMAK